MSHYSKTVRSKVTKTIVAEPSFMENFVDDSPGKWIKTSYNIRGGVYYDGATPASDQSVINDDEGRKRKNYGGIGFTYDAAKDAFIPPQPFASWTLNNTTYLWEPPIDRPNYDKPYRWNESDKKWEEIS